jgi:hypothetical protein
MYTPSDLADWTDRDLVELWLERVAIRLMPVANKQETPGEVRQAEYLAAQELRRWLGARTLPDEARQALRKFRN